MNAHMTTLSIDEAEPTPERASMPPCPSGAGGRRIRKPRGRRNRDDECMPTEQFVLEDHEVIVLDRVIGEITERDDFEVLVPHPADRQALHNLLCLLEREDVAVFDPHYDARVESARKRLMHEDD